MPFHTHPYEQVMCCANVHLTHKMPECFHIGGPRPCEDTHKILTSETKSPYSCPWGSRPEVNPQGRALVSHQT